MPLQNPFFPAAFDAQTDGGPHFRIGHPAVQNIDTEGLGIVNQLDSFFPAVAGQPFGTKTDFTDAKTGISKISVTHYSSSFPSENALPICSPITWYPL